MHRSQTRFPRNLSQFVPSVLIVAIGAGGFVWLSAKDAPPQRVAKQPTPPLVETIALQGGVSSFQIHVSGNVVPRREVTLSAEVAGAVIFKDALIESGRHVRQGTLLLQIDPARFELQVKELGSELQQVTVDLRRLATEERGTNSLIQLAEREVEIAIAASRRLKVLALKNVVTDAELEAGDRSELQARNILRVLLNQRELIPIRRERLQAQQKLTEIKQKQTQLSLDHTRIVAPFSGVLATVMVELGSYVQPGDVLLELVDTSAVDVECSLQMEDLYWLWNSSLGSDEKYEGVPRRSMAPSPESSKQVQTALDGVPPQLTDVEDANPQDAFRKTGDAGGDDVGKVFDIPTADATVTGEVAGRLFHWGGKLARYEGHGFNRKTRTVLCRVRVADPIRAHADDGPPTLMRGMYVTVSLNITPRTRLWHIPTRAVQPNDQVWMVEDGLLRVHKIQPAKVLPDGVLVRADSTVLKPGDRVVITQLVTPLDGSSVRESVKDRKSDVTTIRDGGNSP